MKILLCLFALIFLSACNLTSNADVPSPLAVAPTPHVETASSATPSISSGTVEIPGVGEITSTPPIGTPTSIIETATPVETFAPTATPLHEVVVMPQELRVQPNVDAAETAAFPYCGETFKLNLPNDPSGLFDK